MKPRLRLRLDGRIATVPGDSRPPVLLRMQAADKAGTTLDWLVRGRLPTPRQGAAL